VGDEEPSFSKAKGKFVLLGWNNPVQTLRVRDCMVRQRLCRESSASLGGQQVESVSNEPLRQWSLTVSWPTLADLSGSRRLRAMTFHLYSALSRNTVSSFEPLSRRNIMVYEERMRIYLV